MGFLAPLGALIWGSLLNILGTLVGRVMVAIGIGVTTYAGFQTLLTGLRNEVVMNLQGLAPQIVQMLALMKVGTAVSMVISAITIKLTLSGLTGDTLKRWSAR